MINRLFFLYCLTACSEYQLSEKKALDDVTDETIVEDITDTEDITIDTGIEETGDNQIDEHAPVAVCSVAPNPVTPPFTPATFDGSNSYDTSGNTIVSYYWELVEQPEGSAALLPFNSGIYISDFYADLAGEYVGELTVMNELGLSDSCRVSFWQHSGDDMDLHLLAPSGILETNSDCYYANCAWVGLDWGLMGVTEDNPKLDIDDIPGAGPENINIYAPQTDGMYTVYVHDYPGSVYSGPNDVTINIYLNGSLVWSDTRPIYIENSYTQFALIDWSTQTVTTL
jgi:hypothetical protein